ncbi:MAG TPA: DNA translocase FtsK 4TM domain-containing protein, partial [Rhizomicrobium sp.]|nr:DNA translocase FtsK 4TM domain-containing protein [Rhizomicrobium sp.]
MASSKMIGGVYHPRAKGGAMQDAMADARRAMNRLIRMLVMRGAGLALVLAAAAALIALVSYNADDASLNNANVRDVSNWLGPLGAVASDMLLQVFGLAAVTFLAPLFVWGARALRGKSLKYAMWRLVAWPLGTLLTAAGLGLLPAPERLPAGFGGWIGIAATNLSARAAVTWHAGWAGWSLPLLLLLVGLPLAFLATGLRFMPLYRGALNIPATGIWLWGLIKKPNFGGHHDDDDNEEHDYEDDDEGAYHVGADEDEASPGTARPEPIAAARLAERQKTRVKREAAKAAPPKRGDKQPALNLDSGEYQLPALGLLAEPVAVKDTHQLSDEALEENARMLEAVLADFGVKGRITAVRPGPVVTLYEFEPAAGVKSSRVISLADDVARSMSAVAARIATISGRNVIGIELPNQVRETVYLREMFASADYEKARAPLSVVLGKTIGGEPVVADLAKMPHLLVAGTTGSGKSVGLNTMILSILFRMPPSQCRLIMIDPKMLELSVYDGIPHLLSPVVTDPRKAIVALKWAVREMEDRYRKMSKMGVRGVEAFNERVKKAKDKGEVLKRTVQTGFDRETGKPIYEDENLEFESMPYIVVVVDEVADLMMVSGKEIEGAVQRLAQMARA